MMVDRRVTVAEVIELEVVGLIVGVVSESCLRDAEVVERVT